MANYHQKTRYKAVFPHFEPTFGQKGLRGLKP